METARHRCADVVILQLGPHRPSQRRGAHLAQWAALGGMPLTADSIVFDPLRNLEYISSAGLRVLMLA